MPAFRNLIGWFNEVTRRGYSGPVLAALVLDDGTLVHIDYRKGWSERTRAQTFFDRYVGHVTLVPRPNKWDFEAKSPIDPIDTLFSRCEYDSAEEAAAAMLGHVAEMKEKNDAIVADPEKHLDQELSRFDWTAEYSDAPGVCGASDRHWGFIQTLRSQVEAATWERLLKRHSPWV